MEVVTTRTDPQHQEQDVEQIDVPISDVKFNTPIPSTVLLAPYVGGFQSDELNFFAPSRDVMTNPTGSTCYLGALLNLLFSFKFSHLFYHIFQRLTALLGAPAACSVPSPCQMLFQLQ